LQIIIPGSIFAIKNDKKTLIKELLVFYFSFFFVVLKELFKKIDQEPDEEEIPTWI